MPFNYQQKAVLQDVFDSHSFSEPDVVDVQTLATLGSRIEAEELGAVPKLPARGVLTFDNWVALVEQSIVAGNTEQLVDCILGSSVQFLFESGASLPLQTVKDLLTPIVGAISELQLSKMWAKAATNGPKGTEVVQHKDFVQLLRELKRKGMFARPTILKDAVIACRASRGLPVPSSSSGGPPSPTAGLRHAKGAHSPTAPAPSPPAGPASPAAPASPGSAEPSSPESSSPSAAKNRWGAVLRKVGSLRAQQKETPNFAEESPPKVAPKASPVKNKSPPQDSVPPPPPPKEKPIVAEATLSRGSSSVLPTAPTPPEAIRQEEPNTAAQRAEVKAITVAATTQTEDGDIQGPNTVESGAQTEGLVSISPPRNRKESPSRRRADTAEAERRSVSPTATGPSIPAVEQEAPMSAEDYRRTLNIIEGQNNLLLQLRKQLYDNAIDQIENRENEIAAEVYEEERQKAQFASTPALRSSSWQKSLEGLTFVPSSLRSNSKSPGNKRPLPAPSDTTTYTYTSSSPCKGSTCRSERLPVEHLLLEAGVPPDPAVTEPALASVLDTRVSQADALKQKLGAYEKVLHEWERDVELKERAAERMLQLKRKEDLILSATQSDLKARTELERLTAPNSDAHFATGHRSEDNLTGHPPSHHHLYQPRPALGVVRALTGDKTASTAAKEAHFNSFQQHQPAGGPSAAGTARRSTWGASTGSSAGVAGSRIAPAAVSLKKNAAGIREQFQEHRSHLAQEDELTSAFARHHANTYTDAVQWQESQLRPESMTIGGHHHQPHPTTTAMAGRNQYASPSKVTPTSARRTLYARDDPVHRMPTN